MTLHQDEFEAEKKQMMAFMQEHDRFTLTEVFDHLGGRSARRTLFLKKLRSNGTLRVCGSKNRAKLLTLKDPITLIDRAAQKRDTPEGAMWTAIRVMRKFQHDDVVIALASTENAVSLTEVKTYCGSLLGAGYIKVIVKAHPSIQRPAEYLLVRDTGPLPPRAKRMRVVVDGNSDTVVHVQGARL